MLRTGYSADVMSSREDLFLPTGQNGDHLGRRDLNGITTPDKLFALGDPINGTHEADFVIMIGDGTVNAAGGDDFVLGDINAFFRGYGRFDSFINAPSLDSLATPWTTEENPLFADSSIPHATVFAEPDAGGRLYFALHMDVGDTITLDIDSAAGTLGAEANSNTVVDLFHHTDLIDPVAWNDDSASVDLGSVNRLDSYLTFTASVAGTYYMRVGEFDLAFSDRSGLFEGDEQFLLNISLTDHEVVSANPHGSDIINGDDGDDQLFGTGGNDRISGDAGDDLIHGGTGHDTLFGGAGSDQLFGYDGDDILFGGEDDDRLHGESGDDTLSGEDGNDRLFGGAGGDALLGGLGDDKIHGDEGEDNIIGGDGSDRLFGGAGNDAIDGGLGNDKIFGGDGDDNAIGGDGNDRLFGGDGADALNGGNGRDKMFGNAGNDSLVGGAGEDRLFGGSGEDVLAGGGGDDKLFGDGGSDTIGGGDGDDLFIFRGDSGTDTVADFEGGADRIHLFDYREENGGQALSLDQLLITQQGSDTRIELDLDRDGIADTIDLDGNSTPDVWQIDLLNTDASTITAADFVF